MLTTVAANTVDFVVPILNNKRRVDKDQHVPYTHCASFQVLQLVGSGGRVGCLTDKGQWLNVSN